MECGLIKSWDSHIPLKEVDIIGKLINAFAHVTAKFIYENQSDTQANANFVFPLNNVTIYHFEAEVGGSKIFAQCRPKAEAESTYDEAVEAGNTAFVMHQSDHCEDVFSMDIGNIPGKSTVIINLKYVTLMDARNVIEKNGDFKHSEISFVLATVLNPRYTPAEKQIPDVTELTNKTIDYSFNSTPYVFKIHLDAEMPCETIGIESVHDQFLVEYTNTSRRSASITLKNEFKADHDFLMLVKLREKLHSMATVECGKKDKQGLFAMHCLTAQFLPEISEQISSIESRNELVFMIDRSGSMYGDRIRYAKSSLLLLLKSLPLNCRFQIVGFGSSHETLFTESQLYGEESLNRAMEYHKALDADMGGTEMLNAFQAVLNSPITGDGWFRQVIILTDGEIDNPDEVTGLIKMKVSTTRVHAIGLGDGVSTALVSGIAQAGRGLCAFARDESQLNSAVMRILNAALQRRTDKVKIDWQLFETNPKTNQSSALNVLTVPRAMGPVYCGEYLTCHGFFDCVDIANLSGKVGLHFEILGKQTTLEVDVKSILLLNDAISAEFQPLHRLAGKCQIQELMNEFNEQVMQNEMENKRETRSLSKGIKNQIETLSCELNIMSTFTSMVGVDTEEKVCNPCPKPKWSYENSSACYSSGRSKYSNKVRLQTPCCAVPTFGGQQLSSRPYNKRAPQKLFCSKRRNSNSNNNNSIFVQKLHCSTPMFDDVDYDDESLGDPCGDTVDDTKLSPHVQLANLQNFQGYWQFNDDLFNLIGVDSQSVMSKCPKITDLGNTNELVWATAVTLAYLELKLSAVKDQWLLLSTKARNWLCEQLGNAKLTKASVTERCEELVSEATTILNNLNC